MASIIQVTGEFNSQLVSHVKRSLKALPKEETDIIFRINSHGGNLGVLQNIFGFMYYMTKYRNRKIIGQLVYGESAGLLLFLNCQIRQVMTGSIGVIHLPVPNTGTVSTKETETMRQKTASFIARRTENKMAVSQAFEYEYECLSPKDMLDFGIATEKVNFLETEHLQ